MLSVIKKIFGNRNNKVINECRQKVVKINGLEVEIANLSNEDLKVKTQYFRAKLNNGEALDDLLIEAFAVVRETAKRLLNMRHYDVQLIGGMLLHKGCIAEMKTGEGKTLVATLPVYLNALKHNVHIVTVNDYLTKRDRQWMGRIFEFLGLSVSCVISSTNLEERKEAYNSDVLYVTNSELGFDYLRDNMQMEARDILLGPEKFHYAIIDEIDSILIDEARTPLIISGPSGNSSDMYAKIDKIIRSLDKTCFSVDEKHNTAQLTEEGEAEVEQKLKNAGLIKKDHSLYEIDSYELMNHILQSLKAHYCLHKDKDYILMKGEVMLIDEFTGRVAEGRRYSGGLHQAIEAKEKINILNENQTLASITYQNFFRMYKKLSGMTGTAMTEANEFYGIYKLEVISVPTFKSIIRIDQQDCVFRTEDEKLDYITSLVKERRRKGQPILIGTVSIKKSELYSKKLKAEGIKHNVLNAKYHEEEANIIAEAGRKDAVTIATNMAGRGTDILLGGSVDAKILNAIEGITDSEQIKSITAEIRSDHEIERQEVVNVGGLLVIGSERHESRRIDNQLRGRSGRLGDPGESQFFLSLQDDLLRIFGGDKLDGILSKLGLKEGEAMQHSMLNRVIEKSQRRLESFHYEIRKNVVRYDDIINDQRKMVYEQRLSFLRSNDLSKIIRSIISNLHNVLIEPLLQERGVANINNVEESLKNVYKESLLSKIKSALPSKVDSVTLVPFLEMLNNEVMKEYWQKFSQYTEESGKIIRFILLNTLDKCWQEHLNNASHIREGIHLRAYGQKDPFTEYKKELFDSLEEMFRGFDFLTIRSVINLEVNLSSADHVDQLSHKDRPSSSYIGHDSTYDMNEDDAKLQESGLSASNLIESGTEVKKQGRNELCNCGSKLKYKHCHGKVNGQ